MVLQVLHCPHGQGPEAHEYPAVCIASLPVAERRRVAETRRSHIATTVHTGARPVVQAVCGPGSQYRLSRRWTELFSISCRNRVVSQFAI